MKNLLQALKALGSPIKYWDHMTVFLLSNKIAPRSQSKWEDLLTISRDPTVPASFQELCKFLESERKALSLMESNNEYEGGPQEKELPKVVKNPTVFKKDKK